MNSALLLAAGSGSRMQGAVEDKILAPLGGRPVVCHSIQAFLDSGCVDRLVVVYRDSEQRAALEQAIIPDYGTGPSSHGCKAATKGKIPSSRDSKPCADCQLVFIHDCARPLIQAESIQSLAHAAETDGAACLAHPVADTIKRIETAGHLQKTSLEDLERNRLWAMETPQAFHHSTILRAYRKVAARS